jgi:methylglutaconyl-CoA hydratase
MKDFTTIDLNIDQKIATVWLNRPEAHNAFNGIMIRELIKCYEYVGQLKDPRVIILRGKGKSFCSGADLQWMTQSVDYDVSLKNSAEMAACFNTIHNSAKPTIAIVHGAVYGGANGLMCASDIAIAIENTKFSFPELRVGLVPSTILPYVLMRMNPHKAKLYMYTGRIIRDEEALASGLVDYIFSNSEIEAQTQILVDELLKSSPHAIAECKSLINIFSEKMTQKKMIDKTVKSITTMKLSEEGREGVSAYFEKRIPKWMNDL